MSEENLSLDSILDGEVQDDEVLNENEAPVVDEVVEVVEGVKLEENSDEVEDNKTQPKDNTETIEELKANISALHIKNQDEKGKRQRLEEQMRAQQADIPAPDAYADPDAAISHAVTQAKREMDNRFLNMSEMNAKNRHSEDYDQMNAIFFDKIAVDNPGILAQAYNEADPYEFVYKTAKNHNEMAELQNAGGFENYRQRVEEEMREKIMAELKQDDKQKAEKILQDSIPETLANKRSTGGNHSEVWDGPPSLNKLVG